METVKMTSLEIAKRSGKEHKNVLRLARKLNIEHVETFYSNGGRKYTMFEFTMENAGIMLDELEKRSRNASNAESETITAVDLATIVTKSSKGNAVTTSLKVAEVFGRNHQHVLRDIDEIMHGANSVQNWTQYFYATTYTDASGKKNRMFIMSKDGFTLLAMGYNGEKAMRFKIRYIEAFNEMERQLTEMKPQTQLPGDYITALKALLAAEEEKQHLQLESKVMSEQINEQSKAIDMMRPKSDYYDLILQNKSTVLVTQIAQDYGMSAMAFNQILAEMHIQHKVGGQWILFADYIGGGYVQSKPVRIRRSSGREEVKYNTEWTQKGRIFLYSELKKRGIIPMIEQE